MNRGGVVAVCAVALLVGVALGAAIRSLNMRQPPLDPSHPAGKPIPEAALGIDFANQRYDIHCAHPGGAVVVFKRCKILSYTGRSHKVPVDYEDFGRPFENWLKAEMEDGRQVYIQPATIFALEASAPEPAHRG
jgi:hypothetical protein